MRSRTLGVLWVCLVLGLAGCGREPTHLEAPPQDLKGSSGQVAGEVDRVRYYLYLPRPDGTHQLLIELDDNLRIPPDTVGHKGVTWSEAAATEALKRLLLKAPESFPPGAALTSALHSDGGRPTVSFNRAFANSTWWKNEKRAQAAIYALVNTAIVTKEHIYTYSDESAFRILIDGKSIQRLGTMDVSEPIESLARD